MNKKIGITILIIMINIMSPISFSQSRSEYNSGVRLGVSQINITPEIPVIMSGYDARKTPFTGVHDSLYASALFFSSGENKALIITADLIGFKTELADDIKKMISAKIGIPSENIMLTAVHNHGGPSIRTYEDKLPEANDNYIKMLKEKLFLLAADASKNPMPFLMGIGKGRCSMNVNRRAEFADGGIWLGRNQEGPCDHEVDVVRFEDMNHKIMGVLINWPCHGTASGQDNYKITGDWPGAASRYIKKQAGQNVVVAITAGASADINPIYGPGNDFDEIEAVGYQVGKEAWKTFEQTQTFTVKSLESITSEITFPGKKACKDQFPQKSYEAGPDVTLRLSMIKVGDIVLAGISGELMTEIGMEIKNKSPYSATIIVTHCNGSAGYICTDKAFTEGGYEIKVTRLIPGAEKPLINKLLEMIYSL
jgi:neutral ceramidase